jgi:hypothetical protein
MVRKALIILLMAPLIAAALATETSFPLLMLMVGLFLIALTEASARDEQP